MKNPTLIIFDCDGTLVDSEPACAQGLVQALAHFGITDYTPEKIIQQFHGLSNPSLIAALQSMGHQFPANDFLRMVDELEITNARNGSMPASAGAADYIRHLQQQGKTTKIASNAARESSWAKLTGAKLSQFFTQDQIHSGRAPLQPKPAPDVFLQAAQGTKTDQILVIEDSPTGVRAARAAGLTVWGYTGLSHNPGQSRQQLLQHGAEKIFNDYRELFAQ